MNRIVLCALAVTAAASVANAAPVTCAAPSPSSVASSPGFAYTCGGLTFSNFTVENAGNQSVGQVNIGGGGYADIGGVRYVTLNLNPNLTLPPGSAGDAAVRLWYTVTGNSAIPNSSYAITQVGGVMPQKGQYAEALCTKSFGGGTSCPGTQLDSFTVAGPSNTLQWGTHVFDQRTVYVYKEISGPAPIHTTALSQVFRTNGPLQDIPQTAVPEPASMLLIGTGLIATALFGRRAISK